MVPLCLPAQRKVCASGIGDAIVAFDLGAVAVIRLLLVATTAVICRGGRQHRANPRALQPALRETQRS
jgi:hypothetical protein